MPLLGFPIEAATQSFKGTFSMYSVPCIPLERSVPYTAFSLLQSEWRSIGVQQSRGWVHYAIHRPEPHIMLFRRPLNYGQQAPAAATQQQAQPTAA